MDVLQATVPARIGDFTAALTGLDSPGDYLRDVCRSLESNVVPNGLSIEVETVAERYRILGLFNADPNGKLTRGDHLLPGCRYIDDVAVW